MKRRGFSLMELLVVMGILSIVLTTVFTFMIVMQETYFRTATDITDATEKALGERAIWLNLLNAGPSFNNVVQNDDFGRGFFDLLPDYSSKLINPPAARTRQVTMTQNGPIQEVNFLIFDKQNLPPAYYDSARAYNMVASGNVSLAGSMTFAGLNNNNYLDGINRHLFRQNNLLMVYSPIILRAPNAAMTTAPRFTVFTGRVSGAALTADTGGGLIRNTQPVTGQPLTNLDQFFMSAPPIGSANHMVLVAGVTLIRYRVQPVPQSALLQKQAAAGGFMLQRQVWNGTTWDQNTSIAVGLTRATFKRESLSIPTITADLQFNY